MSEHTSTRFPTTRWSLVERAAAQPEPRRREALQELLRRYVRPLTAYLIRGRHFAAADADDLVQGFITEQVLEGQLLEAADSSKGRFRTFLLGALNKYASVQARNEKRLKRGGGLVASLDEGLEPPGDDLGPQAVFDVEWARAVLGEAVEQARRECEQTGRLDLWGVFTARVLGPILADREPVAYRELAARYGFESPEQASNGLVTAKRLFGRCLRAVVGQYAAGSEDVEAELADLRDVVSRLSRSGTELPELPLEEG